jgi:uncharacterized membrane protein
MNVIPHLVAWGILAIVVIALFLYHRWLENHEDHYIHLHADGHDTAIVGSQTTVAKRIAAVDKLKNALLVALIVYALAIIGLATYAAWNAPTP